MPITRLLRFSAATLRRRISCRCQDFICAKVNSNSLRIMSATTRNASVTSNLFCMKDSNAIGSPAKEKARILV